jgi:hypothetical protein
MCRWTNALPWFIVNLKLCQKDPQHLEEYLSEWKKMRQDWLDNRGRLQDGSCWMEIRNAFGDNRGDWPFEHHMTTSYAPHPYCAPQGYGLVFVDMMTDQIIHSQGYTNFSRIAGVHFQMEGRNSDDTRLDTLLREGRFPEYFTNGEDTPHPLETRNWDEVLGLVTQDKASWHQFSVDLSPFTITRYEESDIEAHQEMKKHVESLITLTDDDEQEWDKWFAQLKEYAEENAEE